MPATRPLVSTAIVLLLFASTPTAAWHWPDETEYERFNTRAGDPRVQEDAERCFNETAQMEDVGCSVFYAHFTSTTPGLEYMNTQRIPDCAPLTTSHASSNPLFPAEVSWTFTALHGAACDQGPTGVWPWLQANLTLSPAAAITAHFHLHADPVQGSAPDDLRVGALPCLTVQMGLYERNPPGDRAFIASGSTTKTVLSSSTSLVGPVEDPCPESTAMVHEEEATEFVVDLGAVGTRLPLAYAPLLEIEVYRSDGTEGLVGTSGWSVISSPEHQNRIVFPVEEALTLWRLDLVGQADETKIQILAQSAWGATDVDPANVRVTLLDEEQNEIPLRHLGTTEIMNPLDNQTPGVNSPVNITIPWDPKQEELDPGDYTLRATVTNWQHTRDASRALNFTLHENNDLEVHLSDGAQPSGSDTTGLGRDVLPYAISAMVVLIVAALLGVAWLRRDHW